MKLKEWLRGTNAKFLILSPEQHDYLTGVVSHFPHIIAASLVHQAYRSSRNQELIPRLAAGGFRDITRIASSSPAMWRDILLHNRSILLHLLEEWKEEMERVKKMLEECNHEKYLIIFQAPSNSAMSCRKRKRGDPGIL